MSIAEQPRPSANPLNGEKYRARHCRVRDGGADEQKALRSKRSDTPSIHCFFLFHSLYQYDDELKLIGKACAGYEKALGLYHITTLACEDCIIQTGLASTLTYVYDCNVYSLVIYFYINIKQVEMHIGISTRNMIYNRWML